MMDEIHKMLTNSSALPQSSRAETLAETLKKGKMYV